MKLDLCSDHSGEGPSVMDLPIPLELKQEWMALASRRQFLSRAGKSLAWASIAGLFAKTGSAAQAAEMQAAMLPHMAPKAKRAIYLFMAGAPSQLETWDYKPNLVQHFDQDLPESIRGGQLLTGMTASQTRFPVAPSIYQFKQHGKAGHWVSELFPHLAKVSDELAVIRSMHTDAINHEPAILLMNSGNMVPGKPSIGSWVSYGLGSMNDDLPTFVVLTSKLATQKNIQALSSRLWSAGFLSPETSGVALRSGGNPVIHLSNPKGVPSAIRRAMIDGVGEMNRKLFTRIGDPETNARISQYEMAFRMQTSVPELTDLSSEPQSTWDMYGEKAKEQGTYAYNCLMARRLAERGVRFTQIFHRGWDNHTNLPKDMKTLAEDIDQPTAALLADLKQRGLLEDTLVVWGGEFGRTVYSQGGLSATNYGRDHHPRCFSMWMAGGGVKVGTVYGETDDFSYNIVKNPMHIRDLNATILSLLGVDHERLTFKFQGLDQRLTGVEPARVVRELLG
ncbi:MAG: DUF1501 domain-containing protein [Akkermansiaceae bacterium]|nr:DUF1501 domain-containing protein [Akkermansiaceae bacterium]